MVEIFRSPRRLLLFAFETALLAVLFIVAGCIRLGMHEGLTYPHIAKRAIFSALVLQAAGYYTGAYDRYAVQTPRAIYMRTLQALALGGAVLLGVFYSFKPLQIGRGIFLAALAMSSRTRSSGGAFSSISRNASGA